MAKFLRFFFKNKEYAFLSIFSLMLAINAFFFIAREVEWLSFAAISKNTSIFYLFFGLFGSLILATTLYYSREKNDYRKGMAKLLLGFLPFESLIVVGIANSNDFHRIFTINIGLYLMTVGFFLIYRRKFRWIKKEDGTFFDNASIWLKAQGRLAWGIIMLVMTVNLLFGSYHLAKFAAVDEPLWTFERIPQFWSNLLEGDFKKTAVSDKPGITVAIISGAGMLFENPKTYKKHYKNGGVDSSPYDMADLNFAFRFPILLFTILMLPFFYFLLERLLGRTTALYSYVLLGLSPILIGMASIINPDSLLWVFAPLSFLSFLAYAKKRNYGYLYLAGVFLGLSLLTKYVANILFIFFLSYIFIEYIFHRKNYSDLTVRRFIKESLTDYLILTFTALATFYLLYPAVWVSPSMIFKATVFSQAFETTWPLFAAFFLLLVMDMLLLKGRLFSKILDLLSRNRKSIAISLSVFFLFCLTFSILNVYLGMRWHDFEAIIGSPKTSYSAGGYDGLFFANFFPLAFTITPIALAFLLFSTVWSILDKRRSSRLESVIFSIILFILLYYLATTVNKVAAMNRYQIMVFPLAIILGGIGLGIFHEKYLKKSRFANLSYFILIAAATASLYSAKPFFISYDSSLLPKKYYTDLKDMGTGSYEAAEFINSLPNADRLKVWTDKRGACSFMKAKCLSGFDYMEFREEGIDYAIVSSGRESRTKKLVGTYIYTNKKGLIRFDKLYDKDDEDVIYKLEINGRPRNYVKVIRFDMEEYENTR